MKTQSLSRALRYAGLGLVQLIVFVSTCAAGTFANPPMLPTPTPPLSIATADLNQDGHPDLVILSGSFTGHTVTILHGRGDGTFEHVQDLSIPGSICCRLNLADVTGDGRKDIIIGGRGAQGIQVGTLVGLAGGTFADVQVSVLNAIQTGTPDGVIGVGDLNGDGKVDLAIPDGQLAVMWIAYGNNQGGFTPGTSFGIGGVYAAYIVDLNGDGRSDILAMDFLGSSADVVLQNTDGTFQLPARYSPGPGAANLIPYDVDGDGLLDIVGVAYPNQLVFFKGHSDGTFAPGVSVKNTSGTLAQVADYNNDGILDFAMLTQTGVSTLAGQGGLTYGNDKESIAGASSALRPADAFASADFNGDGKLDIALGTFGGVVLLFGKGDGTFAGVQSYDVGHSVSAIAVAPFDAGTTKDIAVSISSAVLPRLLSGDGAGNFVLGVDPPGTIEGGGERMRVGDFNGDGKKDVVRNVFHAAGPYYGNGEISFGNGDGTFQSPVTIAGAADAAGDFNNDGRTDVISLSRDTPLLTVFLGQSNNTFSTASTVLRLAAGGVVAMGDLNHDGKLDLVLPGNTTTMQTWFGNGDGTFSFAQEFSLNDFRAIGTDGSAALADLDGDGNLDLVAVAQWDYLPHATYDIAVFYGTSNGMLGPPVMIGVRQPYSAVRIGDVDGDGKPDIVLAQGNGLGVLINQGGRVFASEQNFVAGGNPTDFSLVDVNGDGRLDIVAPNAGTNKVVVLLNGSNQQRVVAGTLLFSPEPSEFAQPYSATLAVSVPSGSPSPTGTVSFSVDGIFRSTITLANGTATYVDAQQSAPGPHTVVAQYNGDANYDPKAFLQQHTVNPPVYTTTTAISVTPTSLLTSQTLRIIATVTTAGPRLRGTVTFYDAGLILGSRDLDSNFNAASTGTAQFDTALLSAGAHTITARYQGNLLHIPTTTITEIYSPSESAPVPVTVNTIATATTISGPTSAPAGTVVTFTASVSAASASPFGSVSFYSGTRLLGTRSLLSSGTVSFSTASLAAGTASVHAQFNANGTFAESVSTNLPITIAAAPAMKIATVTALREASTDLSATLIAQITALDKIAQGQVTLLDSGSVVGRAPIDSAGEARFSLPAPVTGDHRYTASFAGDDNHAPSVSPELISVWPDARAQFIVRLAAMEPGSVAVVVSRSTSFDAEVHLACGDGLPPGYVCSFSPPTVEKGSRSILTIHRNSVADAPFSKTWTFFSMFLAAGLLCLEVRTRRRRAYWVFTTLILVSIAGCSTRMISADRAVVTVQASSGSGQYEVVRSAQLPIQLPKD